MKRICSFMLALLFCASLLGCSKNVSANNGEINKPAGFEDVKAEGTDKPGDKAGITGYVMAIKDGRILVVSSDLQDFSSSGGVNEFYDAIWFTKASQDVKLGDKVKVWYDLVLDSYPGQSEAKSVEVIPGNKPDGAGLTESQALKKALESGTVEKVDVVAVKSIVYDKKADEWNVKLKSVWSEKVYDIQVKDKE